LERLELRPHRGRLFDLSQLRENLFVRRPLRVIDFDELPAHDSRSIDDVRRRMRPASAIRIEDAVTIYDFVAFVLQKYKIVAAW
jgi:hypothetical protein